MDGASIEDSFWAPHDVIVEIQDFLAEHEDTLYSKRSFSEAAVAFSVQSAYDWAERNGSGDKHPFWRTCDGLVEQHQPFDVVMFPRACCARTCSRSRTSTSTASSCPSAPS